MQRAWVVSPAYRSMIEAITTIRSEQGITQRELARRLGKPPSFVNKIEQLERRLDLLEFIAIAEAMGLDASGAISRIRGTLPDSIQL